MTITQSETDHTESMAGLTGPGAFFLPRRLLLRSLPLPRSHHHPSPGYSHAIDLAVSQLRLQLSIITPACPYGAAPMPVSALHCSRFAVTDVS